MKLPKRTKIAIAIGVILPVLILLIPGCGEKEEPMFKEGQTVCVTKDNSSPYPVGKIFKITKLKDKYDNEEYIYHIKLYDSKLKGYIISRNKLEDIYEFSKDKTD
jgi:hypothetical protein